YAGTDFGMLKSSSGGNLWTRINIGLIVSGNVPSIASLVIDPQMPATLYAGGGVGGVFKTTDGGANWTASSTGLPTSSSVTALAVDPKTSGTVYAGVGKGVYKTVDGGKTWFPRNIGLERIEEVDSLVIDPQTPSTLYLSEARRPRKSTNSGATWSLAQENFIYPIGNFLAIDPQTGTLYSGGYEGGYPGDPSSSMFKSTDGGKSWSAINNGLPHGSVTSVAVDRRHPSTIYVGLQLATLQEGSGVFKSADAGATWILSNTGRFDDS